jgi:hypothetical protein
MPPQDLLTALRRRPFEPFLLHVTDGTIYEVRHPELVMLSVTSAVVGVPAKGGAPPQIERCEIVDLRHIGRLVPLGLPPSPGNGQQQGQP